MIKFRLEWYFEHNSLIPRNQFGFRKGNGTIDAVTTLVTDIQHCLTENTYLAALFVDIKGAYDTVNLSLLQNKLTHYGLSSSTSTNISEIYNNRPVYLKDSVNNYHGPRIACQGLPQGSVLSPILFNIYTASIHEVWDDTITCIQYADDLVIYSTQSTYKDCVTVLKHIAYCLKCWLDNHNFELSENKSAVMIFSRHRIDPGTRTLNLNTYAIPHVDEYKYLGIILDKKLLWTKYINYIKTKCEKGINILKSVTRAKWGADPKTAIMFYKSYILSIIDYGSILYGSASASNLKTIDRIQYKALRICIGAMQSSPNEAVLAESQEPPLQLRRQYLSNKFFAKIQIYNTGLYNNVCSLAIEILTNAFWIHRNSPPLAESFLEYQAYANQVVPQNNYSIFLLEYGFVHLKSNVLFPQYSNNEVLNSGILNKCLENSPTCKIFTDGSKTAEGTGCAFYIPKFSVSSTFKLFKECTIFSAEAFAINQALSWVIDFYIKVPNPAYKNITILSDSKSVLLSIRNFGYKQYKNDIICKIKHQESIVSAAGFDIKYVWVKGHSNIVGNCIADHLAKQSIKNQGVTHPFFPMTDFFHIYKKKQKQRWQTLWETYVANSSNHYTKIHPELPTFLPHISSHKVSRFFSTTVTRLKLNHGRFPQHLNRIGILGSPLCSCDKESIADLNHIIFNCKHNSQATTEFIKKLSSLNIDLPTNITVLLHYNNLHIFNTIVTFLKDIKLDL